MLQLIHYLIARLIISQFRITPVETTQVETTQVETTLEETTPVATTLAETIPAIRVETILITPTYTHGLVLILILLEIQSLLLGMSIVQ